MMRTIAAVLTLSFLAAPAMAQVGGAGGAPESKQAKKEDPAPRKPAPAPATRR